MTTLAAQMMKEELVEIIEAAIERKLLELFDNFDDGLELKQNVRDRLFHQQEMMAQGERGQFFDDVVQQLD